jgi:hypothetical protein
MKINFENLNNIYKNQTQQWNDEMYISKKLILFINFLQNIFYFSKFVNFLFTKVSGSERF